ncbi:hypothetical protein YC2023_123557 [Brassica napus]
MKYADKSLRRERSLGVRKKSYQRKTCRICFDDDFEVDQMLSVALCGHQFCVECMKQYVEAMLLEGRVPRCPHYQCGSKPTLRSFASLLTPKLKKMWEQKIQEDSIPVLDRTEVRTEVTLKSENLSN